MSEFQPAQPSKTNGMAIAGFVVALVCCGPLGIVFSAIGLNQINKNPSQGGRGLAVAGLVIGIITTIVALVAWANWAAWFATYDDIYSY